MWRTDGTVAGTFLVKDIQPGIANGIGDYFDLTAYALNGIVYFRGNDGINGIELWRSDGTTAGTYMVKDCTPGPGDSSPGEFASVNNTLYFTNQTGTQLWKSDGTAAGTNSIYSFSIISNLYGFNNALYFAADIANTGQELWKSNGTTGGTNLLLDLNGVTGTSLPCNFHATTNTLYFMANTASGWELWKTNGNAATTMMVKDINPGGNNGVMVSYQDAEMNHLGDTLYFRADDGATGYQLWRSDGTDTGTVRLSNFPVSVDPYCAFPLVNGNVLVNNFSMEHYWQYDPDADTITETGYPSFVYFNSYPKFAFAGNVLVYAAKDSAYGCEMWLSDGTVNGERKIQETHLVNNWTPMSFQGFNTVLGVAGNKVLFTQARRPYDTQIPLYVYDVSNAGSCYAPSLIVPVPVADTSAHFIWNRIADATSYDFNYRESGASVWNSVQLPQSFIRLTGLDPATDYEYKVSAYCQGSWTPFSDVAIYNTAFTQNDFIVHILGDRAENDSTHRIYWLKTPQIDTLQIRYRPYGTLAWTTVSNSNGYKRISQLLPHTLYEYSYRAFYGGMWDLWYNTSLFFLTGTDFFTGVDELIAGQYATVYPNPSGTSITVPNTNETTHYLIADQKGQLVKNGQLNSASLDISFLSNGFYFLQLMTKDGKTSILKFVKQE